jgi:hypothetical protein
MGTWTWAKWFSEIKGGTGNGLLAADISYSKKVSLMMTIWRRIVHLSGISEILKTYLLHYHCLKIAYLVSLEIGNKRLNLQRAWFFN